MDTVFHGDYFLPSQRSLHMYFTVTIVILRDDFLQDDNRHGDCISHTYVTSEATPFANEGCGLLGYMLRRREERGTTD